MLTALTRAVSRSLVSCELTFHTRQPIDLDLAIAQHHAYENALGAMGVQVISLPAEPDLPDAVFVEDPLIVVDEFAILTRMGAASRRAEAVTLEKAISRYRPLRQIVAPATLEGGDVMRIGRDVFIGLSSRTNREGVDQMRCLLMPLGYRVVSVAVRGCLHLKSACCSIGDGRILTNRKWIEATPLADYEIVDLPAAEPGAANILRIGEKVLMPSAFPETARMLRSFGLDIVPLDISELMKAEAAVTCSSVIFPKKGTDAFFGPDI
jgi:dimethylargininase